MACVRACDGGREVFSVYDADEGSPPNVIGRGKLAIDALGGGSFALSSPIFGESGCSVERRDLCAIGEAGRREAARQRGGTASVSL